ncbi:hypothetical protein [Actinoplanes rectilineatus]|uniref:hypothetical protein n=1 Tax=Actinoplanes rectilineatus TaxID=113571 RepID=UPI0005F2FA21|nr:hypothetical protein [Actinoplanes rectilineatus]
MTEPIDTTATAEVTLTVNGLTKTFTATVATNGDPATAARSALEAVDNDATQWTYKELRYELADAVRQELAENLR